MQDKRTRRRLLADMLFVGGALLGASVLGRSEPFFDQMLEGQATQTPPPPPIALEPPSCTEAYPSDGDHDAVTKAYPSDADHDMVSCRYPSDSDSHAPEVSQSTDETDVKLAPPRRSRPTSARPFWSWFA